jgi:hypothetical protein
VLPLRHFALYQGEDQMSKHCRCPKGAKPVGRAKNRGCMAHKKIKGCNRFVRVKKICGR